MLKHPAEFTVHTQRGKGEGRDIMTKSAIISHCGKYRYRLDRMVSDSGPVYAFFGVNPSTADASVDDATVRKWRGFVQRWGGSRFIVGNAFAYRSTDVRQLAAVEDPSDPQTRATCARWRHHHWRRQCSDSLRRMRTPGQSRTPLGQGGSGTCHIH